MAAKAPTQQIEPTSSCCPGDALRTRRLALIANLGNCLRLTYRLSKQCDDDSVHAVVKRLCDRVAAMADETPGDPQHIEHELEAAESELVTARALLEKFGMPR